MEAATVQQNEVKQYSVDSIQWIHSMYYIRDLFEIHSGPTSLGSIRDSIPRIQQKTDVLAI